MRCFSVGLILLRLSTLKWFFQIFEFIHSLQVRQLLSTDNIAFSKFKAILVCRPKIT